MQEFKKKYSLIERQQKSEKQLAQNPGKVPIIAEPHRKSKLPRLGNAKFLCQDNYKFSTVATILSKKIQKANIAKDAKFALFIYVNDNLIKGEQLISEVYKKYKDEDGFLYIKYGEMEAYG